MTMRIHGDKIEFPDGTEQFTASTGGGGEAQPPVVFRGNLSADQSVPKSTFTKINLDTPSTDTDNALVEDIVCVSVLIALKATGGVAVPPPLPVDAVNCSVPSGNSILSPCILIVII